MMYNSLDRLLDGIAVTLRDEVAPHVDDPYVRAQAHAAAELIVHLAEHVEWRCDQLRAEIEAARVVLRGDDDPVPLIVDNKELIATHDALLVAVAELQRSSVDTAERETLDAFVRHYHANELDRFTAARQRARR
jgi:hypothetical protein